MTQQTLHSWRHRIPSWQQLVYSGHLYSPLERTVLVLALVIFLFSLSWIIISQAGTTIVEKSVSGGTYTEALVGQPKYINPIFATASAVDTDLTRLIFAGLVKYNNDLEIELDLAENIEVNTDGTQYTIKLKDNLSWHDGEKLTANDIKFTYDSIRDIELKSPLAGTFENVVVEVLDDKTVRLSIAAPYASFLHILTVGIIPEHVWRNIPRNEWHDSDFNLRPIGNGSWQFSSFKTNSQGEIASYTLRKNENSHRPPNINKVIFSFFNSESAALSALKARAVHGFAFGLGRIPSEEDAQSGVTYSQLTTPASTAIFFNVGQTKVLESKRVREALQLAIDRRALTLEVLAGQVTPLYQAIPKQLLSNEIKLPTVQFDTKAAENLLDRAGWERIGAIRKNSADETLSLNLTVIDREPDKNIAKEVQKAWQSIGVDVTIQLIRPVTAENIQRSVLEQRNYDALIFTTVYGADIDLYPFWHSSQRVHPGLNLSQVADQNLDDAIIDIRRAQDTEAKNKALEDVIIRIDSLIPAIFLYSPQLVYAQSDKIHGMMSTQVAVPADRFNDVDNWFAESTYRLENKR